MTDKEKQAIFQDLYELYQEGDLGAETASWMKAHEQQFQHVVLREENSLQRRWKARMTMTI
nr:hypothetical protein P5627_16360 [Bacillus safensis]